MVRWILHLRLFIYLFLLHLIQFLFNACQPFDIGTRLRQDQFRHFKVNFHKHDSLWDSTLALAQPLYYKQFVQLTSTIFGMTNYHASSYFQKNYASRHTLSANTLFILLSIDKAHMHILLLLQKLVESSNVFTVKRSQRILNRNRIIGCIIDDNGYWTRLNHPMYPGPITTNIGRLTICKQQSTQFLSLK